MREKNWERKKHLPMKKQSWISFWSLNRCPPNKFSLFLSWFAEQCDDCYWIASLYIISKNKNMQKKVFTKISWSAIINTVLGILSSERKVPESQHDTLFVVERILVQLSQELDNAAIPCVWGCFQLGWWSCPGKRKVKYHSEFSVYFTFNILVNLIWCDF